MNKASEGNGIPDELFQILKDDAVKVLHSTCQQIWKIQQWPQDWRRSVFIPMPFFGIGMKLTFSSPVATATFSKFAGMLSAALSQHHLPGFGIAQLEFHPLH